MTTFQGGRTEYIQGIVAPQLMVSDLIIWLDASQGITLNGSDVSQWDDLSGNGNDMSQGTPLDQPLYTASNSNFNNEGTIDFDGVDHNLSGTFHASVPKPWFLFAVFTANAAAAGVDYVFSADKAADDARMAVDDGNDLITLNGSANTQYSKTIPFTTPIVLSFSSVSGTSEIWENGVSVDTGSEPNDDFDTNGMFLGQHRSGSNQFNGSIAHFILYKKTLSVTEHNLIGRELSNQYALTWTDV